MELKVL